MNSGEFIRKILDGETNFARIRLNGRDLFSHPDYGVLIAYLKGHLNGRGDRLILNSSVLKGLMAPELYLPYVEAMGADFSHSYMPRANFAYGVCNGSNFRRSKSVGIIFRNASLPEVDFEHADLDEGDFDVAYVPGTNFRNASMRNVKNLESSLQLSEALFSHTRVTPSEKSVIERAFFGKGSLEVHTA